MFTCVSVCACACACVFCVCFVCFIPEADQYVISVKGDHERGGGGASEEGNEKGVCPPFSFHRGLLVETDGRYIYSTCPVPGRSYPLHSFLHDLSPTCPKTICLPCLASLRDASPILPRRERRRGGGCESEF